MHLSLGFCVIPTIHPIQSDAESLVTRTPEPLTRRCLVTVLSYSSYPPTPHDTSTRGITPPNPNHHLPPRRLLSTLISFLVTCPESCLRNMFVLTYMYRPFRFRRYFPETACATTAIFPSGVLLVNMIDTSLSTLPRLHCTRHRYPHLFLPTHSACLLSPIGNSAPCPAAAHYSAYFQVWDKIPTGGRISAFKCVFQWWVDHLTTV